MQIERLLASGSGPALLVGLVHRRGPPPLPPPPAHPTALGQDSTPTAPCPLHFRPVLLPSDAMTDYHRRTAAEEAAHRRGNALASIVVALSLTTVRAEGGVWKGHSLGRQPRLQ